MKKKTRCIQLMFVTELTYSIYSLHMTQPNNGRSRTFNISTVRMVCRSNVNEMYDVFGFVLFFSLSLQFCSFAPTQQRQRSFYTINNEQCESSIFFPRPGIMQIVENF